MDAPNADNPGAQDFEIVNPVKVAKVKWYNVTRGWGFVTIEDSGEDVFVHQSNIQMSGFRQLVEGDQVEVHVKRTERGLEATLITGLNGTDYVTVETRPHKARRSRKVRCYNCGEFKNHIAAKCPESAAVKRCHNCKSNEHMIAECPTRPPRKSKSKRKTELNQSVDDTMVAGPSSQAVIYHPAVDENSDNLPASSTETVDEETSYIDE